MAFGNVNFIKYKMFGIVVFLGLPELFSAAASSFLDRAPSPLASNLFEDEQ